MTVKGELEIDSERGVIYFHANEPNESGGVTILRICRLPKPIPTDCQLDITHMHGTNWSDHDPNLRI